MPGASIGGKRMGEGGGVVGMLSPKYYALIVLNTENSYPVFTLYKYKVSMQITFTYQHGWHRQGKITSSTSSITPFEQFGTFEAHREVLLLSLWPSFLDIISSSSHF